MRIIRRIASKLLSKQKDITKVYYKNFKKYAFTSKKYKNEQQYEASITKMYHSVEKGLSYPEYRAGFGRDNIESLIAAMTEYSREYDVSAFFYKTALGTLKEYVRKNKEYGLDDPLLEARIDALAGEANDLGGIIEFEPYTKGSENFDFEDFVKSRHSIRHFSKDPVDIDAVKRAVGLAQHTPSACNRQGWKTRIIRDKKVLKTVLSNQNGNRGFGDEIDALLVVTGDIRYFNKSREVHQVFVDGGMYAMNLLHALNYEHIAAVPLSAALFYTQEKAVKQCLGIDDAETLILFVGIGNYPSKCVTTRSERRPAEIEII